VSGRGRRPGEAGRVIVALPGGIVGQVQLAFDHRELKKVDPPVFDLGPLGRQLLLHGEPGQIGRSLPIQRERGVPQLGRQVGDLAPEVLQPLPGVPAAQPEGLQVNPGGDVVLKEAGVAILAAGGQNRLQPHAVDFAPELRRSRHQGHRHLRLSMP